MFRARRQGRETRPVRTRKDRGAAMVEFVIVVPLLLLLVLGIINFGFILGQQLSLNNAVREGARAAVAAGSSSAHTPAGVTSHVQNAVGPLISDNSNVAVTSYLTPTSGSAAASGTILCNDSFDVATGDRRSIKVVATYNTSFLAPLPVPGIGPNFTLKAESVYRCEFS